MDSAATANPVLSGIAEEFVSDQSGFIGMKIFPIFRSGEQSGQYYVHNKENLVNMATGLQRAPGAAYQRTKMQLSDDTFVCRDVGLEVPVDDTERKKYANHFDADAAATRRAMATVMYNHEIDVKTEVEANAPSSIPSAKWDTATTTPLEIQTDFRTASEAVRLGVGMKPNVCFMTEDVYFGITTNPLVVAQIKYTASMGLFEQIQALANFLGVERIEIASGVHNTANTGQTVNVADIWGDDVYLAYVNPAQDLEAVNAGRTFLWTAETGGSDVVVESYREDRIRSDIHRARQYRGLKTTGAAAMYRLNNVLA